MTEGNLLKLGGYRFYEEVLGSPKYVVAPMASWWSGSFPGLSRWFLLFAGLDISIPQIRSTGEGNHIFANGALHDWHAAKLVYTPMINAKASQLILHTPNTFY
jgi:tRNA-dihydrouridine synthase